ncbi:MAG: magnesium transporter [Patiriisocius sp.]|jgi:magnesium transporter
MIQRYTQKKLTWLDVLNPTPDEIREIAAEAGIPSEFTSDLTVMIPHSETFHVKGALKITLDFPIVRRTDIKHPHEIKFIATKTHLVTIRFEDIESMHRFAKEFEVLCMLKNKTVTEPAALLVTMLNYLYDAMYLKLDYLETKMKDVEEEIFNEHEREMVFEISGVSRRLITFKQTLSAHENALSRLRGALGFSFGKKYEARVDELEHHYRNLNRQVYALSSTLDDLRDTNMALLSTKQNETMKIFTILAFITFPLTLFTSMFGMNTETTPIVGNEGDFWIILSIMVIVSIAFFALFKYKRWI